MNRRQFVTGLAATAGCMALGVRDLATAYAAGTTHREDWRNLDAWDAVDHPENCRVSDGKLIVTGPTVLRHKTLVFRRDQPMSLSGWLQSNDLKSKKPTYFGAVLQAISDGNYYGSAAIANWIDERNGIFGPHWIIFCNEWQQSSQWWAPNGQRIKNNISGQQPYSLTWAPSQADGGRGAWRMILSGKSHSSPNLPLVSDCRPSLGFGRGNATAGPLTMVGTV